MQDHPIQKSFSPVSNAIGAPRTETAPNVDDIARVFNSALVSTRVSENRNASSELHGLMESAPFRVILTAVRQLARTQGITERQAAEQMIQTFRKVDQIWGDYVYQEGVDRLRGQLNS